MLLYQMHDPTVEMSMFAGLNEVFFPELILLPPLSTLYKPHPLCFLLLQLSTMISTNHDRKQASSSWQTVTVMYINAEGFSSPKGQVIGKLCHKIDCDILPKTNRGLQYSRPKVPGMKLVVERPREKYGTAIFISHEAIIDQTSLTDSDNVEIL